MKTKDNPVQSIRELHTALTSLVSSNRTVKHRQRDLLIRCEAIMEGTTRLEPKHRELFRKLALSAEILSMDLCKDQILVDTIHRITSQILSWTYVGSLGSKLD